MYFMDDDNMAASIVQYLMYKKINVLDSFEELQESIDNRELTTK